MKHVKIFEQFINDNLNEGVDMAELEFTLKRVKKENPDKKVGFTFIKDAPKGYKISIDGKYVSESVITEKKEMYKIAIDTEVEDAKIGNKFYNVKKGEIVELIDDDGDIAKVKLKSGEIVNIESEHVNEESKRSTDFYGDSKYGNDIHSLLNGKWDSKKVENYLEKLGGGNDIKYARIIDFISGDAGLNIRKYKNIGEQLPDLMKQLEILYKDFLTESAVTETYGSHDTYIKK